MSYITGDFLVYPTEREHVSKQKCTILAVDLPEDNYKQFAKTVKRMLDKGRQTTVVLASIDELMPDIWDLVMRYAELTNWQVMDEASRGHVSERLYEEASVKHFAQFGNVLALVISERAYDSAFSEGLLVDDYYGAAPDATVPVWVVYHDGLVHCTCC